MVGRWWPGNVNLRSGLSPALGGHGENFGAGVASNEGYARMAERFGSAGLGVGDDGGRADA